MGTYADISKYTKDELEMWDKIKELEGKEFKTFRGIPFTYRIVGNQIYFSRKKSPINRSMVNACYRKANELKVLTGPKKMGLFGASYLYPVFGAIGVCKCEPKKRKKDIAEENKNDETAEKDDKE